MSVAVMYRQVIKVPATAWPEFRRLENEMEQAELEAGHPAPRRYRPFVGAESFSTRVYTRIYDSYAEFASLLAQRYQSETLQKLDAKKYNMIEWERDELYYVDSGAPVPRWMQAVSRKPFEPEYVNCAIPKPATAILSPEMVRKNIAENKLRVLYRQIQHVPRECWAEKLEQERISDEVEIRQGNPAPLRYRSMHSPENSHIRVSEREYDSFEFNCHITEDFFTEKTPEDAGVMDAEGTRQAFFTWEREELYYVDSDSFEPEWIELMK